MSFTKNLLFIIIALSPFFASASDKKNDSDPLQQRAKSGDVAAQLELGKEYFKGIKRPLNRALALYYFKLAADAGSPEGMFNLGMCYEYGVEYEVNRHQAYYWYCKADNFVPALFKKALFLENGIPAVKKSRSYRRAIPADTALAKNILNDLIKKEYPPALTHQAKKYLQSSNSSKTEFSEAFKLLSLAVSKGDISAYRLLADCYEWGMGCEKDEKKAFELLQKSASAGDGGSAVKLGSYYEHGIGTAPDLAKAVEFYQKSAEFGEPAGMVKLAKHYSSGFILKTDLAKAIELCNHAASLNERSAFTLLAQFHAQGIGMEQDEKKAFMLYLKAAAMGDPEAQYHLAIAFKNGSGTPVDMSGAIYWMKKAASVRYVPALETLEKWNKK
ncbi:MAG: SEL1-like repeat protein [Lentisphaeria bacterium]|nr:SEL1-like repeat protein [Lentisphaeria bacterium]